MATSNHLKKLNLEGKAGVIVFIISNSNYFPQTYSKSNKTSDAIRKINSLLSGELSKNEKDAIYYLQMMARNTAKIVNSRDTIKKTYLSKLK